MRCLDEATAAAMAGEFEEIVAAGWTFCFLLNACERVRDFERAAEWCRKVEEFSRLMRTNFVTLACRATTAPCSPGTAAGRRPRSRSLRRSASPSSGPPGAVWRSCGSPICAADRALRRGRGAPPAETGQPSHASGHGRARSRPGRSLRGGRPARARPPAPPGGEQDPARGASRGAREAKVATGAADAAASYVTELRSIADALGTRPLRASLSLSEGLVAVAAGDHDSARARSRTPSSYSPRAAPPSSSRERGSSSRGFSRRSTARTRPCARRRVRCRSSTRLEQWPRQHELGIYFGHSAPHRRLGATSVATQSPTRGRDPAPRRGGAYGRRHRSAARAQQAHGSSPSSERLRQARLLLARRGGDEGEQAAPASSRAAWPRQAMRALGLPRRRHVRRTRRYSIERRAKETERCRLRKHAPAIPTTCLPDKPPSSSGFSFSPASGSRAGADCSRR